MSQKAAINKSAREALSMITTDLRNTGYYHVNFENNNCSKLNSSQINQFLIGVTHNKKNLNGVGAAINISIL